MKIKLPPTPESRSIVAEQKSLDSREKVAQYDLDSLLNIPDQAEEPAPIVVEAPVQRKTSAAQLAATKKWNEKQYRMTLRISPELKAELDQCAGSNGVSATKFIEQAIKEKIARES